jgi:hypothetical protein
MNDKQRRKIEKLIDALNAGLTAHDLLQDIYTEVSIGNVKLPVELEVKLDDYMSRIYE